MSSGLHRQQPVPLSAGPPPPPGRDRAFQTHPAGNLRPGRSHVLHDDSNVETLVTRCDTPLCSPFGKNVSSRLSEEAEVWPARHGLVGQVAVNSAGLTTSGLFRLQDEATE